MQKANSLKYDASYILNLDIHNMRGISPGDKISMKLFIGQLAMWVICILPTM